MDWEKHAGGEDGRIGDGLTTDHTASRKTQALECNPYINDKEISENKMYSIVKSPPPEKKTKKKTKVDVDFHVVLLKKRETLANPTYKSLPSD